MHVVYRHQYFYSMEDLVACLKRPLRWPALVRDATQRPEL